jgi:DNA polymerase-3 subunit alpha
LNNAQNQNDINDGHELARIKNIKIRPIKFGKSRINYYPDKETNSIYKGISSIKGFGEKIDIANELLQFVEKHYTTFIDLLIDIEENTSLGDSKTETLIKLNYFSDFGRNRKLLDIFTEFTKGKNKYDKKHTDTTKQKRIPLLYEYEKTVEDIALPIKDQITFEQEVLGEPMSIFELPRHVFVLDVDTKNSPRLSVYGLYTGKNDIIKIDKKTYNKSKVQKGDIVFIDKFKMKPRAKFNGNDEKGKPMFSYTDEKDCWITDYKIKKF